MSSQKPRAHPLRRNIVSLAIALVVAMGLFSEFLIERYTGHFLRNIEAKVVDLRLRLRGPREPSGEVVIVAIDSKSIEKLGRWPWSRTTHADLIAQLRQWRASTLAYDVLFTEVEGVREAQYLRTIAESLPPAGSDDGGEAVIRVRQTIERTLRQVEVDKIFAEELAKTYDDDAALTVLAFDFVFEEDLGHMRHLGAVLGPDDEQTILDIASYISRDENVAMLRHEPPSLALGVRPVITGLTEWSAALGYANPVFDKDGALRRERLAVVYSPAVREAFQGKRNTAAALLDPTARVQAYMPLAVAAVATHLRLSVDQLILDLPTGELRFPMPGEEQSERVHYFDPFDGTSRIDFYGSTGIFPTYSFVDVLNDDLREPDGKKLDGAEVFADKIVLIGTTDHGLGDFFVTPFTARLPGVEKHANVAENILAGRQLRSHRDDVLVLGVTVLIAAILVALLSANLGTMAASLLTAAATLTYLITTYADFVNNGMVWNWTVPILTTILAYSGVTGYRSAVERRAKRDLAQRSRFIQDTFGRYLSDQVVERLVDNPDALALGGERRRITIMMSDLRGFSSLCERSTPDVVVGLLNHYLAAMTEIIFKYGGTIDEFIGDAILALFGAPVTRDDDASRAVACAIEMQLVMDQVNTFLREHDFPEVEMGIAINTGDVIVGNIGSERRAKYGIVGSNVNLTARIESHTVGGQVFISQNTLDETGDVVETGSSIKVRAKGFSEPIPVHEVRGIGPPFDLHLPEDDEVLVNLPEPVVVEYNLLEGKDVTAVSRRARLVRLGAHGADMECNEKLEAMLNLKLVVFAPDGAPFDHDVYVKVVNRQAPAGCAALAFTSTPDEIKQYFAKLTG